MKQNQRGQMRRATHRRHIPKSLVRRVIGWSLVVLGLLGLALPVLPGLILFAIAIVLLGPHDPTLRRLAVWVRLVLRRWSQAKQRHVRRLGIFVRQWYAHNGWCCAGCCIGTSMARKAGNHISRF
jgi:uncharacterized membrane protein YbaN (DUF454 family)